MNRTVLIGIVGGILVVAAIVLNYVFDAGDSAPVTTPPEVAKTAPEVVPPALKPRIILPSFDIARVDSKGNAVIAGRGAPGAQITVADQLADIGGVEADGRGEWVLLPEQPLAPGERVLSVRSQLAAQEPVAGRETIVLIVPERGKDGLAVKIGPDSVTVLQKERTGGPGVPLAIDIVDYGADGVISVSGTAPPGATLRVYVDNAPVADLKSEEDGSWRASPEAAVEVGTHALRVDQVGPNDKVIARVETEFERKKLPREIARAVVTVKPGNSLWRIARRTYGSGVRYSLIFNANKEQIRNPDLIYPGQVFVLPKVP